MLSRLNFAFRILFIGAVINFIGCQTASEMKWELSSPDGLIQIVVSLEGNSGKDGMPA